MACLYAGPLGSPFRGRVERARLPRRAFFAGAIHHASWRLPKVGAMSPAQEKRCARLTRDLLLEERPAETAAGASEARRWLPILARYREPNAMRGWLELGITTAALAAT